MSLGLSQVVGVPLCWLKIASSNHDTDVQLVRPHPPEEYWFMKGSNIPETSQSSTVLAWSICQQQKIGGRIRWCCYQWPTLRLLPQLGRNSNTGCNTSCHSKYVLNMSCKCPYAKHMTMAQAAITRWHCYIHTRSFFPCGVAVGWDALLGELANSKRVAVALISLSRFSSCDREFPGERAVVIDFFLQAVCDCFSSKTKSCSVTKIKLY